MADDKPIGEPEQWKVGENAGVWVGPVIRSEKKYVAFVCGQSTENARLIAAAPDLLAALKLLRDPDQDGRWRCDCDDPHFDGGMCENCVATLAIRKAEGNAEEDK